MSDDTTFYTMTMAKIYIQQGHHRKAEKIYRYLLKKSPDRNDIKRALDQIEINLSSQQYQAKSGKRDELIALFNEWLKLVKTYNFKKKLKRIKRSRVEWVE